MTYIKMIGGLSLVTCLVSSTRLIGSQGRGEVELELELICNAQYPGRDKDGALPTGFGARTTFAFGRGFAALGKFL